jgi:hypothetical protein
MYGNWQIDGLSTAKNIETGPSDLHKIKDDFSWIPPVSRPFLHGIEAMYKYA